MNSYLKIDIMVNANLIQEANPDLKWTSYYQQACEGFRLYSNNIREIRILTIVQGIAVLAGASFLLNGHLYAESMGAIIFGLFLTLTLWSLHRLYFTHCNTLLDYISDTLEAGNGPWSSYRKNRKKYFGAKFRRELLTHGVFFFILSSLIVLMGIVLIKYFVS